MSATTLLNRIALGREGKNQGLSMGLPKLEGVIDGVCRETSTMVMGGTGSGKSSFTLYAYVFRPIMDHLEDDKYRCFYASLEMNEEMIQCKLLSMYLFEKFGRDLSVKEILSRKKDYTLSDKDFELVKESMEWLKKTEKILTVWDKPLNAVVFARELRSRLEKMGTFRDVGNREIYMPDNPEMIYQVIIDHVGLIRPRPGKSLKEEIDDTSAICVRYRETCGISPLYVVQVNRDSNNIERRKAGIDSYRLGDAKDTGNVEQDSEIVIAINDPFRNKHTTHNGYDLRALRDNYRGISILKSRYGQASIDIGLDFFGKLSLWKELPRADEINDYARYTTLQYYKGDYIEAQTQENITDTSNVNYTFTL